MSGTADVLSLDAIARMRAALIRFIEEADSILLGLDRQGQRMLNWLETDSALYWRMEVLRCHEQISRARSAIDTAMMRKTKDYRPACIEEKNNLQYAKDRLKQAEEKTQLVRKWSRVVREELEEYRGKINQLKDVVAIHVPRGVVLLENTLRTLERYAEISPPSASASEPSSVGVQDSGGGANQFTTQASDPSEFSANRNDRVSGGSQEPNGTIGVCSVQGDDISKQVGAKHEIG